MDDTTTGKLGASPDSTQDEALDEILRAVAHAPPRRPEPDPAHPGEGWGAGGRYMIERRLGRGGMGTVYSATDTLLHREVALKVLDAGSGDDEAAQRARLLREARIAARIEHEHVARIYDVGEHEGALFVAMELVRGVTLRSWMAGRTAVVGEILDVAGQISEGLAALHASGVFHRDLKPENVMLTEKGGVRLLDFGLARQVARADAEGQGTAPVGGERTSPPNPEGESLAFAGTPGYMAPEQCEGKPLDARVDVFALGVIVYELVTGIRPFVGERSGDIVAATQRAAPDFAGDAWLRVPPRLQEICARMLARDPGERFADGAAAGDALRAIVAEREAPIVVLPPSGSLAFAEAPTVLASVPRRRWRAWGLLGAAATLGAAVLVVAQVRHPAAPLPPPAPGMAWIDVGTITVGHTAEELDRECAAIGPGCDRKRMQREVPSTRVTVPPFQLDVYEVTNEEMAATLQMLSGGWISATDNQAAWTTAM
jgi:predicted Ser/Thr protein kinase